MSHVASTGIQLIVGNIINFYNSQPVDITTQVPVEFDILVVFFGETGSTNLPQAVIDITTRV